MNLQIQLICRYEIPNSLTPSRVGGLPIDYYLRWLWAFEVFPGVLDNRQLNCSELHKHIIRTGRAFFEVHEEE